MGDHLSRTHTFEIQRVDNSPNKSGTRTRRIPLFYSFSFLRQMVVGPSIFQETQTIKVGEGIIHHDMTLTVYI